MTFSQSVIETMQRRQSIRTFDNQQVLESDYKKINDYIRNEGNLIGPFGEKGKIELIQVNNNITDKGIKLGTYGFIKNPKAYLVGMAKNNKYSLIEFGYVFHRLVLYLSELKLGTCWMGGTFSRNSFEKEIQLNKEDFIPCVTPIGYPKDKQRVFDKALRFVVKADNKKHWDQLFYDTNFETTLKKEEAGAFERLIEMVRIGPSASNKQPWRIVVSDDRKKCHFYIEHTPNYSAKLGYDMQLLDMGIAMCQFDLAGKELKMDGKWRIEDPEIDLPNQQLEYISTWRLN